MRDRRFIIFACITSFLSPFIAGSLSKLVTPKTQNVPPIKLEAIPAYMNIDICKTAYPDYLIDGRVRRWVPGMETCKI